MIRRFSVIVAISLVACFSAFPQGDKKAYKTIVLNQKLSGKLDSVGQYFVDKKVLSGSVSMIFYQGRMVYEGALGKQSIEEDQPMQMNSLFRIASMTKPITTTAVLILVDEGKLSLDDKAEKYLPQFASIKVPNEKGELEQPKQHVTIRHLLMHTSGTRSRVDAWYRENNIPVSSASTLEEYVDLLLKAPLLFHPGEGFNYAMNNDICARIVELITGMNYGEFLEQRIFNPLDMKSTWFIVPDAELNRLSSIYGLEDGKLKLVEGKEPVQSVFPRGNGQLVTSAGDYMNFLQMLVHRGEFKGKRILSERSVRYLTEDRLPANIPLKVGNTVFPNTGFGLSVAISRRVSDPWVPMPVEFVNLFQHLPHGCYLWPGITNTFFWVDPANDITGVVLSQFTNPAVVGNFQAFAQTFYSSFLGGVQGQKNRKR